MDSLVLLAFVVTIVSVKTAASSAKIPFANERYQDLHHTFGKDQTASLVKYWQRPRNLHVVMKVFLLRNKQHQTFPLRCIKCPQNKTIIAKKDAKCSLFTLPRLTSCASMDGQPGRRLHLFHKGKRQGRIQFLPEGSHTITLLIKNASSLVQSCSFKYNIKVNRCHPLPRISNGITACSHGRLWGSICSFHCQQEHLMHGSPSSVCTGNDRRVWWSQPPPYCIDEDSCIKPSLSSSVILKCSSEKNGDAAQAVSNGTICEYHCNPGFQLTFEDNTDFEPSALPPTIQCLDGKWNASYFVQCREFRCIKPNDPPNGYFRCHSNEYGTEIPHELPQSTQCEVVCQEGFVIPRDQKHSTFIHCIGPHWNSTDFAQCRNAAAPIPKSNMCINQTLLASSLTITVPKAEFRTDSGADAEVTCTLEGVYGIGSYGNTCTATDPIFGTTADCKYTVTIKVVSCSEPPLNPLMALNCTNLLNGTYPMGTVCEYSCARGFTIPTSNLHLTAIRCEETLEWNSTHLPECKRAVLPVLVPGTCNDITMETLDPKSETLPLPKFLGGALVSCNMSTVENYGSFTNWCTAVDPDLRTSYSCSYEIFVKDIKCENLAPPVNGHLECHKDEKKRRCNVICKEGFQMPLDYMDLPKNAINCDLNDETWDFQSRYNITILPDCLGLDSTYLQTDLHFNVEVDLCDNHRNEQLQNAIKEMLISNNKEICAQIDCTGFSFRCYAAEDGSYVLETTWNVMAKYVSDDELYYDENVPDSEVLLTEIQEAVHNIITADANFHKKLSLFNASLLNGYQQGKINTTCAREGYVLDLETYKCLQCPTGTYYENNECVDCPLNTFQDETGQLTCKSCSANRITWLKGTRFMSQCKGPTERVTHHEMDSSFAETSVLSHGEKAEVLSDSEYVDYCSPNPCRNGGVCIRKDNDALCICDKNFQGVLCESAILRCPPSFCFNGGSCQIKRDEITCACLEPYTGKRCESLSHNIAAYTHLNSLSTVRSVSNFNFTPTLNDPCSPSPCENGACLRHPSPPYYSCRCSPGYAGPNCTNLACPSQYASYFCLNGATCVMMKETHAMICLCRSGFMGSRCEFRDG